MSAPGSYEVLLRLRAGAVDGDGIDALPDLDHAPAPWEANVQATCECLSWRGALDTLERRHAEDALGESTYREVPVHARSVVVTAHELLARGRISEAELAAKMDEVRRRFASA